MPIEDLMTILQNGASQYANYVLQLQTEIIANTVRPPRPEDEEDEADVDELDELDEWRHEYINYESIADYLRLRGDELVQQIRWGKYDWWQRANPMLLRRMVRAAEMLEGTQLPSNWSPMRKLKSGDWLRLEDRFRNDCFQNSLMLKRLSEQNRPLILSSNLFAIDALEYSLSKKRPIGANGVGSSKSCSCMQLSRSDSNEKVRSGRYGPYFVLKLTFVVSHLKDVYQCPYYWGSIDRLYADDLLKNQPDGTFLLRDSRRTTHLFTVSFRQKNKTYHRQIDQFKHMFSFDSFDLALHEHVSPVGLIETIRNDRKRQSPFEPVMETPFVRSGPFALQDLCRAIICSRLSYYAINRLEIASTTKDFITEYQYQLKVQIPFLLSDDIMDIVCDSSKTAACNDSQELYASK